MSMNTKLYQPPHEHHPSERGQHSAEGSQSHRQNHSHRQHQSSAASGARPQNVSSSATPHVPPPIFPWELHARAPSRVFSSETESVSSIAEDDFAPSTPGSSATSDIDGSLTPRAESGATLTKSWKSPFAPNVWDDVPAIQDHVSVIRQHKPTRVESSSADGNNDAAVTGHDEAVHPRFQRRASHAETGAVAGIRTPRLTAFRPSTSSSPRIRIGAASSSNFNNFTYSRLPYPSAEGVPSQNEWVRCSPVFDPFFIYFMLWVICSYADCVLAMPVAGDESATGEDGVGEVGSERQTAEKRCDSPLAFNS